VGMLFIENVMFCVVHEEKEKGRGRRGRVEPIPPTSVSPMTRRCTCEKACMSFGTSYRIPVCGISYIFWEYCGRFRPYGLENRQLD
jgi:hypothetical protein